jgi:hypothetical protein
MLTKARRSIGILHSLVGSIDVSQMSLAELRASFLNVCFSRHGGHDSHTLVNTLK